MVTQTWTTSKDLTKTQYRNDPKPGKESSHRNGEDPCQSQSTSSWQRASPQTTCRAWKLQPGRESGGNGELQTSHSGRGDNPRAAEAGGAGEHSGISLHYLLGNCCPAESVGGSSCPMAGGMEAPRRGAGCREGILALGCGPLKHRGLAERMGWRSLKWQRGGICRWAVAGTQGENLGIATVRRAVWGVLHIGTGMQEWVGNLRSPDFLPD